MRFSLPFVSAVIVLTGAPMLWRNLRRGSTKYMRLMPRGFELALGWLSHSGDWAEVEDVTDEAPGQTAPTPNAIVMVMADGSAPTTAAHPARRTVWRYDCSFGSTGSTPITAANSPTAELSSGSLTSGSGPVRSPRGCAKCPRFTACRRADTRSRKFVRA